MRRCSRKVRRGLPTWRAVYAEVDARSQGRCEVHPRCVAQEHHHLFKPRAAFHKAAYILHVCRAGHREFERAYALGRRVPTDFDARVGLYRTALITAVDKFAARRLGLIGGGNGEV